MFNTIWVELEYNVSMQSTSYGDGLVVLKFVILHHIPWDKVPSTLSQQQLSTSVQVNIAFFSFLKTIWVELEYKVSMQSTSHGDGLVVLKFVIWNNRTWDMVRTLSLHLSMH